MENKVLLEEKLKEFSPQKMSFDILKKSIDRMNKGIKSLMGEMDITEYEVDGIKASRSISERMSFNEEVLLDKLKELGMEQLIKTKEYVDMEGLEKAIYKNHIKPEDLVGCQEVKLVESLRVTNKK